MTGTNPFLKQWDLLGAALVSILSLTVYLGNGDITDNPDTLANGATAVSIIHDADLSIEPSEYPAFFDWHFHMNGKESPIDINAWDELLQQRMDEGLLAVNGPKYFVFPAQQPGVYVNVFGPGAACVALPFFLLWQVFIGDLRENPYAVWQAGKFAAASLAAISVGIVFCCARLLIDRTRSTLIALGYAFGTCIWSAASQNLWQHSPMDVFLALATFSLLHPRKRHSLAVLCGLSVGIATICRPTGAFVAATYAGYFLLHERRWLLSYLLGGALPAALLSAYGYCYFGSPFTFGQSASTKAAVLATGNADMWSTPLFLGLSGHLISPSRGLLLFSPFLLVAFWGAAKIWLRSGFMFRELRWVSLATAAILIVQSKFFDWWGGYSYGYRHIVDSMALLVLLIAPVMETILRYRTAQFAIASLLSWSILVQLLGVAVYDTNGWNSRRGYVVKDTDGHVIDYTTSIRTYLDWNNRNPVLAEPALLSIDSAIFRGRLWSTTDNQIAYYLTHLTGSRSRRRMQNEHIASSRGELLAEDHRRLAVTFVAIGDMDKARAHLDRALINSPNSAACKFCDMVLMKQLPREGLNAIVRDQPLVTSDLGTVALLSALPLDLNRHFAYQSFQDPVGSDFEILEQVRAWSSLRLIDPKTSLIQPKRLQEAIEHADHIRLGCLYLSINDVDASRRELAAARALGQSPFVHVLESLVNVRRKSLDEATREINEACQLASFDVDRAIALVVRASIFRARGDFERASADERRAADLRGNDHIPNWLSQLLLDVLGSP